MMQKRGTDMDSGSFCGSFKSVGLNPDVMQSDTIHFYLNFRKCLYA